MLSADEEEPDPEFDPEPELEPVLETVLPDAEWIAGGCFDGWYTEQQAGNKVTADTEFEEDTTIYARWKNSHNWGSWAVIKNSTCVVPGIKEHICSDCGLMDIEEIPAKGHTWNSKVTVDKPATCVEVGFQSTHCTRCGAVKDGSKRTIAKTGHKFSSWITTKKATEIASGRQSHKCSVCGKTETKTLHSLLLHFRQ